jgi:hypothetical protein
MDILRWLVAIIAMLICVAGAGWYAVYLFTPDPRAAARVALRAAPGPLTPYERRQTRRSVLLGVAAAIGGLIVSVEALDSIRTGVPIHVLNGPDMNGWVALGADLFVIALGCWLATSSLRKMWGSPR